MSEKAFAKPSASILPYAWVILAIVYLASVVAPFNQSKVPPILPVLMDAYQISLIQAGLLMSTMSVLALVLALPAGVILERLGPKITALIALGSMTAGSILGAVSASYSLLLTSRVIEGIGIGLIGVAAPATIAQWFPPAKQGTPMGIWATWVPVGTVVMYNLAPRLSSSLGWRSVWWVGAAFGLVMVFISGLMLRRPPLERSDPAALVLADVRKALANRDIWLLAVEFACFNLALFAVGTYYPTFLNQVRGYPLERAAFISSIGSLVILVTAPLAGFISDRIGSRRLVFSLPFLAIAVLFLFPFRVTGWLIPAVIIAQGVITGAVPTATFVAAPEVMKRPQWAGLGLAMVLVGQNLGQLVGPVVFSQLVNHLGWEIAGICMIPVCLVGFLSGWRVRIR